MTESESVALPFGDSPIFKTNVIIACSSAKCKPFFYFFLILFPALHVVLMPPANILPLLSCADDMEPYEQARKECGRSSHDGENPSAPVSELQPLDDNIRF